LLVCLFVSLTVVWTHFHYEPLNAYVLLFDKWPSPTTTVYVDFGTNSQWNPSFEDAMAQWNQYTVFKYTVVRTYWDPCANPNTTGVDRNGAGFSNTECGDAWGQFTLAATTNWSQGSTRAQGGVSFNPKWSWSIYNGPWQTGANAQVQDFHRVAVHEL